MIFLVHPHPRDQVPALPGMVLLHLTTRDRARTRETGSRVTRARTRKAPDVLMNGGALRPDQRKLGCQENSRGTPTRSWSEDFRADPRKQGALC